LQRLVPLASLKEGSEQADDNLQLNRETAVISRDQCVVGVHKHVLCLSVGGKNMSSI
jgi:hypothetical protein